MDHMVQATPSNMYMPVSGTPPIPPRGSTLPQRTLKAAPPEVKKKKTKRADNSKGRDTPLMRDISKEIKADERYGFKEKCVTRQTLDDKVVI